MLDAAGKLLLRLTLGVLILLHGIAKVTGGIAGIESMVQSAGLPAPLAYGVYIGEVIAPILVILGFYARVGAVIIAVNMVFAVVLAHAKEWLQLGPQGGWALELPAMFFATALAIALLGPGRWSINRR